MLKVKSKFRIGYVFLFMTALLVAGCATQKLHSSGLSLVQEGQVEEGLAKLEQASNAEPNNPEYRSDLLRTRNQVVSRLLASASGERALGHPENARLIYERILKIDANNHLAKTAIDLLVMDKRHDAMLEEARVSVAKGDPVSARAALRPVLMENPRHGQAMVLLRQLDEQQTKVQLAEPTLTGKFKKPISLQFRDANVKMVFEALSRTSGINVLLDKDIKSDIKTSIFVKDVSVEDAIDLILMQGQLEKKILSDNTVYIYPNTAAKTKDFQDLKIRSFHLTNADPKQMMTMIKTMLKTKDIYVHDKTNSLIMRDTPDAIHLAEKLIADQDIPEPEVMLEVEVLEISRSRLSEIGAKFPTQLTFTALPRTLTSAATNATAAVTQLSVDDLRTINGSSIVTSPAPSITLNAMLQDSDTNILSSPRLRVSNRDKAKIMIGERIPIINNSVTPITGGTGSVVTGTVTYQDVGLKLDVEPDIHLDNEVTIKINLEVSSLGLAVTNSSGSQVYRVGTRNTSTSLRLRDGETQILAGLITDEDRNTVDKVPALGQVPILGRLFSSDKGNKAKTEIILSITPHIVGNYKLPDARDMEYWSGTESVLRSNQLVLKPLGSVSLSSNPPGLPSARAQPLVQNPPATGNAPDAAVTQSLSLAWLGSSQAKVGEKLSLTLNARSTLGVKTLGLQVGFDPAVLKALDVIEGDAMKHNNVPSTLSKNIDQASGSITVDLTGAGANALAGVVTLQFEVIATAQSTSVTLDALSAAGINGEVVTLTPPEVHVISIAP